MKTTASLPKASPQPPRPAGADDAAVEKNDAGKPQGTATRPLQNSRERQDAQAAQDMLQRKGPNALPVSDYPAKQRPPSANPADGHR